MRFLRVSLAPDLVQIDDSVERIDVLNNQYLTDGTVIELSRIESDRELGELFERNPATIEYEVLDVDDGQQFVYHHLRPDESDYSHALLSLVDEHRLIVLYPIRFDARSGATVTLVGTTAMIQEAFDRLPPAVRRHITVEQLTETMPSVGGLRSRLTERQREVLDAAIDLGYYSTPRRVTSADVAEAVGCAPSTASEHLRKIESRVLRELSA